MRVVVGIHQGRDTYNEHTRKKNLNDFYYNSRYYDDRYQGISSLKHCQYKLRSRSGMDSP